MLTYVGNLYTCIEKLICIRIQEYCMNRMEKLDFIIKLLKEHPEGLWITKIGEITGMTKGMIHYYIFGQKKMTKKGEHIYGGYLRNEVDDIEEGKNHIVMIKKRRRIN